MFFLALASITEKVPDNKKISSFFSSKCYYKKTNLLISFLSEMRIIDDEHEILLYHSMIIFFGFNVEKEFSTS